MATIQAPFCYMGSRGVTPFFSPASSEYAWGSQFCSVPELRVQPRFMMTARWPFQSRAIQREGTGIQVEVKQEAAQAVQRVVEESIAVAVSKDGSERFQFEEQAGPTPGSSSQEVIDAAGRVFVPTYARSPVVFVKGEGCKLFDAEGREYLDMSAGIAVNALGHGDPAWVKAVTEQAAALAHVSNVYYSVPQVKLAKRLVDSSFADRVFFVNSGTEANEAAIKFARKYQRVKVKERIEKHWLNIGEEQVATELVAFTSSFHGRTMGALALTSKKQYRAPFEPIMPGVQFVQFGDIEAARKIICPGRTAAVFVEPVQGEGGIFQAEAGFMRSLRTLCSEAGALLVFDEVQCGLGRTGQLWAHEAYELEPDIMTLAKPLAGGLPIGAVLVTEAVSSAILPGDHGSTFAGGPLVCHAALAVLDRIQGPEFLENVAAKGLLLRRLLVEKLGRNPHVKDIRGSGLLVGVELDVPAAPLVEATLSAGLLILTAGSGNIVRLVPPLIISEQEIKQAVQILTKCMIVLD